MTHCANAAGAEAAHERAARLSSGPFPLGFGLEQMPEQLSEVQRVVGEWARLRSTLAGP